MKVVILCGVKGTRMVSQDLPKSFFPVGKKPILWYIMNIYIFIEELLMPIFRWQKAFIIARSGQERFLASEEAGW